MTHATRGNLGKHFGFHHSPHSGGWWKFSLVALVATAIGVAFVYSPLLNGPARTAPSASPVQIEYVTEAQAIPLAPEAPAGIETGLEAVPTTVTEVATAVEPQPNLANDATQLTTAPRAAVDPQPGDIRDVDFAALPMIRNLTGQLGGRVDNALIVYADVTGDGNVDAIVPITSDGTYGNLAYVVFSEGAGTPEPILTRFAGLERGGLILIHDHGLLTETRGIYGPTDANCCPGQIVKTYFRWDGQALVVDRTDTITMPNGPKAD